MKPFRYTAHVIEIPCETAAWPARTRRVAGFSLVEMAVVTLLVAIFLTMGLAAFRASQDAQAVSTTLAKQNAIKDALIGYLRRNGRLPCADIDFSSPDGIENRSTAGDPTTACATSPSNARFGLVPYNTLGLARDAAVDGWGNFFSYQVSNSFPTEAFNPGTPSYNTPIPAPYRDWTLSANFRSGNTGEITVNDRDATGTVIAAATNVVVVIVSHGPNGYGAYTISGTRNSLPSGADELENTNGGTDTVFFSRTPTTDDAATGGAFDDRVMFLKAEDLLGPLFKDGSLKPPAAQLADTFQRIKNAIGQYLLAYPVPYASYSSPYNVSYGTSNCSATVSPPGTPWCRRIPLADVYNGDGNAGNNAPLYDGGVPYANLGMGWSDVWDPWGRPIRYTVNPLIQSVATNGISSTVPAGLNLAYTLQSFGPDRTPGGGDDLSVTVTVTDLRNGLTGVLP
ncbi:MAG TPA: type II secretion system protein [Burkholderiales bacterium]|nr:type II secretion system protein [Burkholderiales bacterium]